MKAITKELRTYCQNKNHHKCAGMIIAILPASGCKNHLVIYAEGGYAVYPFIDQS
jgi:hypothetical protein